MAIVSMNAEQFNLNMQGKTPVLAEFMAPWCVYCRRIAPALEQVARQYGDGLIVGQIDIDKEPQLAGREKIEVVPTLVLYRNGQVVSSIAAPDSKAKIERFLQENLSE